MVVRHSKTNKELIIETAVTLFRNNGYHNTSIYDIAKACDISKSSIFHHTTSKKQLAISAMKWLHNNVKNSLLNVAYDSDQSPKQRLTTLSSNIQNYYANIDGGCLMANFTLELADTIPEFVDHLQDYFKDWVDAIVHIINPKHAKEEAQQLAEEFVSYLEGALMMSNLFGDPKHIERACQKLTKLI